MADKSAIEWTDATWNPITGCSKVSQGCKNCYAEREWARLSANPKLPAYFGRPFTDVRVHEDRLLQPLSWRQPRLVFVNSMSDLFHESVPDSAIDDVFGIMALAPHHTFQVLTKRPERMLKYFHSTEVEWAREGHPPIPGSRRDDITHAIFARFQSAERFTEEQMMLQEERWPLANVWLGVSVEDQASADYRIPLLMEVPAAVRWISAEPLLGSIDLRGKDCQESFLDRYETDTKLDWVVVGGESGPNARPMHPEWARSLRDQCEAANVPFFFKQWGEYVPVHCDAEFGWIPEKTTLASSSQNGNMPPSYLLEAASRGLDDPRFFFIPGQDPEALHTHFAWRVGKKAAGRLLDGREWSQYPKVPELREVHA